MFQRRRRVASNPTFGNGPRTNSSAQAAAALAFLNPQASNTSLSAAAAAAALRARPATPTSVGDVQTRRTLRRTNSNSSAGSSVTGSGRGPPGAQLERKLSSGSMTERTFRDPSPKRGSARSASDDAPPVPTIPKNLAPALPLKSHKRAASLETPVLPRIASPLPQRATGRGSSLQPYRGNQTPMRSGQTISNGSSVQELTGTERPQSRGSVNFSYPTRFRGFGEYGQRQLTSPTPSSASQRSALLQQHDLVYDPNTRTFRPKAELLFIEQGIQDAAERPVSRKKKVAPQGSTGTHLADGTVGGRVHGTAVNAVRSMDNTSEQAEEPQILTQPANATAPRKKKKIPSKSDSGHEFEPKTNSVADYDGDKPEKPRKFNTRAGMLLVKKPSIVREDREGEEAEDNANKASDRQATLEKLESRSIDARTTSPIPKSEPDLSMGHGRGAILASTPNIKSQRQEQLQTVKPPVPTFSTETTATSTHSPGSADAIQVDARTPGPVRVQSISPARNAHFLATPESLAVRHQPPVRSVSPRKSALKPASSSRGSSPNGEMPVGSTTNRASTLSELSDTSTVISEDRALPKKKSVRVSFDDDNNVVLGQADTPVSSDTPVMQSPQGKRGWFGGMGRGKKKDLDDFGDNDDDIMKPRPALPSFGSVREKKPRDADERILVKPTDVSDFTTSSALSVSTATAGDVNEHPLGQSSDYVVGSVLMHDQMSKSAASIPNSREPLPPEVTSVEGSGYISDDDSSVGTTEHIVESSNVSNKEPAIEQEHRSEEKLEDGQGDIFESSALSLSAPGHEESEIHSAKSNGNGAVPSLTLTQSSPLIEETEKDGHEPYVIGGFPHSSAPSPDDLQRNISTLEQVNPSPASVGIAEPEAIVHPSGSLTVGKVASQPTSHGSPTPYDYAEESDGDSVYSDAAEDLSDMQGDGFMSLDAIVESPIVPNISNRAIATPPESPTTRGVKEKSYPKNVPSPEPHEPEKEEGWEKAQEYWKGLTAEKRRKLEQVAWEEIDDSEEEQEVQPLSTPEQPKKTKKVIVRSPPASPQVDQPGADFFPERKYQISPGSKAGQHGPVPAMRSSMRTTQKSDDAIHMRSSMRTPPLIIDQSPHIRKSMRESGPSQASTRVSSETTIVTNPNASLRKINRPVSVPQAETKPDPPPKTKKHVKSISTSQIPIVAVTKTPPVLRRKDSAESDSSFKRARPATEGYSMKRSLRGSQRQEPTVRPQSPDPPASPTRSSRFSLRSLSPTGLARDNPNVGLGRTLRNNRGFSGDSTGPTLRSRALENTMPTSRFSAFGKSKPLPKTRAAPAKASRFADSSDEDDARPTFRSRIVDSDDEDDDISPVPVASKAPRGWGGSTRRENMDDSSDLPDTDDEKPSKQSNLPKAVVTPARAATPSQVGTALASGSLRRSGSGRGFMGPTTTTTTSISAGPTARPNQQRRGSFMSILRRKKPDPTSKVHKVGGESGARQDTPLERTRADLVAVRQDSNISAASGTTSPKLQKRGILKRAGTASTLENWPLPSPHPNTDPALEGYGRPYTSYGPELNEKDLEDGAGPFVPGNPELGARRTTDPGLTSANQTTPTPLKKKKKFTRLRKAFRLDV